MGYGKICTITNYYIMNDLTTRLNGTRFLIAEKVGGRIKVKLGVIIPKEIYTKQVYQRHVRKVLNLFSRSAGSLKLGVFIPDNRESEVVLFNYLENLQILLTESGLTYDMIKL